MSRTEVALPGALERYLARLEAALAAVPQNERREILRETRSHVLERTARAPSRGVDSVLAELGPPEQYAWQFLSEQETPPAPRPTALRGLARLATGRWTTLPLFLTVVAAYGVAFIAFLIALAKLLAPQEWGLWIWYENGRRRILFGTVDARPPGREVLGYWMAVIPLSISLSIHLVISGLLRRVLRRGAAAP